MHVGLTTSLQGAFDLFEGKLVDLSLQMAGFEVVAQDQIKSEEGCAAYYGAQWSVTLQAMPFACSTS